MGTAATIMRMLKLPDGRTRILVQGLARVAVDHLSQTTPFFLAKVRRLDETKAAAGLEIEALQRSVKEGLETRRRTRSARSRRRSDGGGEPR